MSNMREKASFQEKRWRCGIHLIGLYHLIIHTEEKRGKKKFLTVAVVHPIILLLLLS